MDQCCTNCKKTFWLKPSYVARKIEFCSRACKVEYSTNNYEALLLERFMLRVVKEEQPSSPYVPTGCWIWVGDFDDKGYGAIHTEKPTRGKQKAHRISMRLFKPDEVIEGLFVCHSCHNPACVNPDHLHPGTAADNVAESIADGRHGNAKLTTENVRVIRKELLNGASKKELAVRFNIGERRIRDIANGTAWRHVS